MFACFMLENANELRIVQEVKIFPIHRNYSLYLNVRERPLVHFN